MSEIVKISDKLHKKRKAKAVSQTINVKQLRKRKFTIIKLQENNNVIIGIL